MGLPLKSLLEKSREMFNWVREGGAGGSMRAQDIHNRFWLSQKDRWGQEEKMEATSSLSA
jgi:hypothetical protein